MLIVGEKEEKENTVSVRKHGEGDLGSMSTNVFIASVQEEINRSLAPFETTP